MELKTVQKSTFFLMIYSAKSSSFFNFVFIITILVGFRIQTFTEN